MPHGDPRSGRPALRLPVHQLHALRAALQHRPRTSLRPRQHHDARLRDVRACREEYHRQRDRRFHAQPNACPDCWPRLQWLDRSGKPLAERGAALEHGCRHHRGRPSGRGQGHRRIPSLRGCSKPASDRAAPAEKTPRRKSLRPHGAISRCSAQRGRGFRSGSRVALVACGADRDPAAQFGLPTSRITRARQSGLGIMLPYSPLHHLLMQRLGFPVVATSGNRGDEPICIDNDEAVARLAASRMGISIHDRPIARPVDDSVLRQVAGREMLLRRSRGFAPAPIAVPAITNSVLAYGGDLKATIAVADGNQVTIEPAPRGSRLAESRQAFERNLVGFPSSVPRGAQGDRL